jgi:hypothetical protein
MTTVYLAMGSNIGDRMDNLRQACARWTKVATYKLEARSRIYETQSVEGGGPTIFSTPAFACRPPCRRCNCCIAFVTLNTRWEDRNLHGTARV